LNPNGFARVPLPIANVRVSFGSNVPIFAQLEIRTKAKTTMVFLVPDGCTNELSCQ
jgi:hypothetical protein